MHVLKYFLKICIILSPNLLKNVAFSRNSTIANQFSFQLFFKNGSINQRLAWTLAILFLEVEKLTYCKTQWLGEI